MKIILFTEIYECGGIDTFIINIINSWPNKNDSFVVIANSNYPGLQVIEQKLLRTCEIVRYKVSGMPTHYRNNILFRLLNKIWSITFRYLLIFYKIFAFRNLLLQTKADMLMVINGGYPGGDCCRAAAISWGIFSGKSKSIHNFHSIAQKAKWYLCLQEYIVDWFLLKFTSQFVTVSYAAAESMLVRPLIYKKSTINYIHNGVEIKASVFACKNTRKELKISKTAPLCLMLGTYEPRKGHYFLLSAFCKVLVSIPDAYLLICGYGLPEKIKQVSEYVHKFQLSQHVFLMNFRLDISDLLSHSDVLLVASQAYESFGFTSVEAMAHKVPVVATDVGGIPEVVLNNYGGYCIGRSDVDAYAQCIIRLLEDKQLRKEQGDLGYARYKKFFTADVMAAKYAKMIYSQIN